MKKAIIDSMTDIIEVRTLRYHFKAIQDFYEVRFGGPRNAQVEREYLVVRDAVTALYRREVELSIADASGYVQHFDPS